MAGKIQQYAKNGVFMSKSILNLGDEVTLSYNGLLMESGADRLYAHVGFGEQWENSSFLPMYFEDGFFKCNIKIVSNKDFKVSFKDSADNWDNNSYKDYCFKIVSSEIDKKEAVKTEIKATATKTASNVSKVSTSTTTKKAEVKEILEEKPKAKVAKTAANTISKSGSKTVKKETVKKK